MKLRIAGVLLAGAALLGASASIGAQSYRQRGITPIFDGWDTEADGTRLFYFGYINRNSAEVVVPIGPANTFEPAPADRGQPTVFLPGRHEHVFTVRIPPEFTPKDKWVWSLQSEMGPQAANASLDQLYILEQRENEDPNARPPAIRAAHVVANVGVPIQLMPQVTPAKASGQVVVEGAAAEAAGLNVTWSKYRGAGEVTFSAVPGAEPARAAGRGRGRGAEAAPGQFPVACGAKPTAACGAVMARFATPGQYMLRAAARQDGLQGLAFVNVTVNP
jgi:hypothetical protein